MANLTDYEEDSEDVHPPSTSETGEIIVYEKPKEQTELNPNPDESHQKPPASDSCSPRGRITSSNPEISLLLERFYSNEPGFDPCHNPQGGFSLNELLIMEEEIREEYPTFFRYPHLIKYDHKRKCYTDNPNAPFIGNLLLPNRRLDVYRDFVRHLFLSDFPFSKRQIHEMRNLRNHIRSLHSLSKECGEEIFYKYRDEEISTRDDIEIFLDDLPFIDDEEFSPIRLNRYVAMIISEMEYWTEKEVPNPMARYGDRDYFYFDPASFIIRKLTERFPDSTEERIEANFFAKRKEICSEFVEILTSSKFPFTTPQKKNIHEISKSFKFTNGDPDSEEERKFQVEVAKLLKNLNFHDDGPREGISNVKKVRRAFVKFMDDIDDLQKRERKLLSEFERYSLHSADLIWTIKDSLNFSFIPRHFSRLVVGSL